MNQFWMIFWLIVFVACMWFLIATAKWEKEQKAQSEREKELAAQKLREDQEIAQRLKVHQDNIRQEEQRREQLRQSYYFDYEDEVESLDDDEYYEDEEDEGENSEDGNEEDSELEDLNNPHKKSDWSFFQKIISDNQILSFYHFTDRANLPSIKEHGLCAWAFCDNHDIEITLVNSSEQSRSLDRRDNLQNYVRVSFTKQHPMMFIALKEGRIKDPVILEISTEVALWKYTKYADRNAVKNGAKVGDSLEDFKRIRFDLVKKAKHFDIENEEERQFYQAELLILDKIPVKYISNINSF